MRFRTSLEKHLPLKEGEKHLSPTARRIVFREMYFWPNQTITEVTKKNNYDESNKDVYPDRIRITRTYSDGTKAFVDRGSWRNIGEYVDELQDPQALARANRVEKVARRAKVTGVAAVAAGLAVCAIISALPNGGETVPVQPAPTEETQYTIKQCEDVVLGTETLTPVNQPEIASVQAVGGTVCVLSGHDYLVVG